MFSVWLLFLSGGCFLRSFRAHKSVCDSDPMEVSVWCKGKASWRADGIYRVMKPAQIQVFLLIFLPFINLKQQPLLSKSIRNNVIKSELSWKLGWSIILSQIEYVFPFPLWVWLEQQPCSLHLFWVADWAVSQTVWHFGQKSPFLWCVSKTEWFSSAQWVSRSWTQVDAGSWHLLTRDVRKACLLLGLTCLRMVLCGWGGYCGYCSYDCAVVILSYSLTCSIWQNHALFMHGLLETEKLKMKIA